MYPSSAVARPVWVFSLPAVAIVISLLWLRKKRCSLQTDTGGGTGEPVNASDKVLLLQQDPPEPVNSASDCECALENNNVVEDTKTEEEAVDTPDEQQPISQPVAVETELANQPPVEDKPVETDWLQPADEHILVLPETSETAQLAHIGQKADDQPMKEEQPVVMSTAPNSKWGKKNKRKGKKVLLTTMQKMTKPGSERKDASLEQKLAKLDIGGQDGEPKKGLQKLSGERDSANTSPSEVMLASPSLSGYSDTHSEVIIIYSYLLFFPLCQVLRKQCLAELAHSAMRACAGLNFTVLIVSGIER